MSVNKCSRCGLCGHNARTCGGATGKAMTGNLHPGPVDPMPMTPSEIADLVARVKALPNYRPYLLSIRSRERRASL